MKEILLTQGKVALIDDEDTEKVAKYKWHAVKDRNTYYAATKFLGERIYMHHLILGGPWGYITDHKNRNGLDNRRENLRKTDQQGNAQNRGMRSDNTSGVVGVNYDRRKKRWIARLNNKTLGTFSSFEEAVEARKISEVEYQT